MRRRLTSSTLNPRPTPSSLAEAIWWGDAAEVAGRLRRGEEVCWGARLNGRTPLHHVAQFGLAGVAEVLLDTAGVEVDRTDQGGWTPLHLAAFYGYPTIAELLLEAGAGVNRVNRAGETPLLLASRFGLLRLVQLLSSYGATRDLREVRWATRFGRSETAAWLIATADCTTPLHHPTLVPPERARRLMRGGADLRAAIEPGGRTPLSLARELDASGDAPRGSTAWLVLRAAEAIDQGHALTGAWSRRNHYFWPPQVRARAAKLLWLGKWTVGEGEAAEKTLPLSVWVECIMPRAVAEC